MIKAVIFDFDGLILDTESVLYQSWKRLYAQYGCTLPAELWAANIGGYSYEKFHPLKYLEDACGQELDHETLNNQRRAWYVQTVEEQPLLPGVEQVIREAQVLGLRLAVASSSSTAWVPAHLERLGLADAFELIRCGNEVDHVKPHPELYLRALEGLGLHAQEAFAFEDSPKGVAAAKAAGLYCILVPNTVTRLLSIDGADHRLDSLEDCSLSQLLPHIEKAVRVTL